MIRSDRKIIGIILAGGQGQRVGRVNKGLLNLQNKPLVQHVFERLQPQLDKIVISANEDIECYKAITPDVFSDEPTWQGNGPLAGLLSVDTTIRLKEQADLIQVVPCDTPFIPHYLVANLTQALLSKPEYEIAYASTKTCIHPSIFLCKAHINNKLIEHFSNGHHSLKSWIFKHQSVDVFFDDEEAFTNINYMETLAKYQ